MGLARYISSRAGGVSNTFAAPTGIQNGDMLLLVKSYDSILNNFSFLDPAGWTRDATVLANGVAVGLWHKTATGAEPATYNLTDHSPSSSNRVAILCYRDAPIDVIGGFTDPPVISLSSADWPSTASGITVGGGLLIGVWWWRTGTSSTTPPVSLPTGFTARVTNSDQVDSTLLIADATVNPGATGTKTAGLPGNISEGGDYTTAILLGMKNQVVGMAMMV